jgi:hypothetical protein
MAFRRLCRLDLAEPDLGPTTLPEERNVAVFGVFVPIYPER